MERPGSIVDAGIQVSRQRRPAILEGLARRAVLGKLALTKTDRVTIADGGEQIAFGEPPETADLRATIHVKDRRFYADVAFGGTLGSGESYIAGTWTCDDLTALIRIALRNWHVMSGVDNWFSRFIAPVTRLIHFLNRNTAEGSRRNIAAHYDLGNDFFELVLDPTMMYSCGIFERPDATLAEASTAKIDRICRELDLRSRDHVIEIGTGWGGFAIHAARNYGCRVTTTTISQAQHDYAVRRISAAGLQSRITVLLKDYRELEGQFDKAVSIEMIEAVGHHFLDAYFRKCGELLKPDGMMLLQAIVIADQRYEAALRTVDFIKRYIFPGSFIPSVTAIMDSVTRSSDMRLFHLEDITSNYPATLRQWRKNTFANAERVQALGYPDEFLRMWEYYLCYCEGGFLERTIGDVQMLLVKPNFRRDPIAPHL